MKIIKNACYGGYGLSQAVYEKLIEYGLPVKKYTEQKLNTGTGTWNEPEENKGEFVFDRTLSEHTHPSWVGRYWSSIDDNRTHPLIIKAVEEIGSEKASDRFASLEVVEIPDGVSYEIDEYDGIETIRETHRTW